MNTEEGNLFLFSVGSVNPETTTDVFKVTNLHSDFAYLISRTEVEVVLKWQENGWLNGKAVRSRPLETDKAFR